MIYLSQSFIPSILRFVLAISLQTLVIHPVSTLTAELYEVHNREHFEIHAFSFGPDTKDELNLRIKAGVDQFHDVHSMSLHRDCKSCAFS